VFDNLTLGDPSVTEDAVVAAATIAGADSFIRMLPGGYQTMHSGSGGGTAVGLSAGQEQLLGLARALVHHPAVLLSPARGGSQRCWTWRRPGGSGTIARSKGGCGGHKIMEAMALLRTRYSASRLGEPPPSAQAVQAMLESAARVPDHGRLQPWRVMLIEGDARLALGEVLAEGLSRRNPLAGDEALGRERAKALRAPLIIVVATRCDRSAKIPVIEQIVSAGAAAHSIMLAAFAQGLGAMWRTGEAAYDEAVKSALSVGPDDVIVGFIYVGTDIGSPPSRAERPPDEFAHYWPGGSPKPPAA
jgi:nitroreductase